MSIVRAILVLLMVQPLLAASLPIVVEPPDPTSTTPITLVVTELDSCPPKPVVTRDAFTITVTLGRGPCLSPPVLITYRLDIGTLPPGNYTAVVIDEGNVVDGGTVSFTVVGANSTVRAFPSMGTIEGGTIVELLTSINHCASTQLCIPPAITFDGVAATNVTIVGDGHYRATSPPHAAGPVEVRVVSTSFNQSSFAFRYYDPGQAPLPELFERILIPVIYNGSGAYGSEWRTELSVRNNNPHRVEPWNGQHAFGAIDAGAPVTLGGGVSAAAGVFMIVPREAAAGLKLNMRIRDVSREHSGWGTEIPIAREIDFSLDSIELLDIPLLRSGDFRRALRIYSLSSLPDQVLVKAYSMESGVQLAQKFVTLISEAPCAQPGPCASDRPSFAMLDLDQALPNFGSPTRAGITIDRYGGPAVWGFVTVTNNETQHVTVISPQ